MKKEWANMSGELTITIEATNERNEKERFKIKCYVSPKINTHEKFTNIGNIAFYSAKLRKLYFSEVIDIKEK